MNHYLIVDRIEICITNFPEYFEHLGYEIRKLCTYPVPAQGWIYMYEVMDLRIMECYYFMVNHLPHKNDDGTMKNRFEYREMLKSDNSMEAFVEFAEDAKPYAM